MEKVTLQIESPDGRQTVEVEREISIGRTPQANVVIDDQGLSRVNTTIFRDGDEVLVVDEDSSNGTFLNGSRITGEPRILFDGDELKMGLETRVSVRIGEGAAFREPSRTSAPEKKVSSSASSSAPRPAAAAPKAAARKRRSDAEIIMYVAAGSTFLIIIAAILVIVLFRDSGGPTTADGRPGTQMNSDLLIPLAVQDPFGGSKQEDIDELVQYFEVQDEINTDDLQDVTGSAPAANEEENYNVTVAYFKEMQAKALEPRNGPTGNDPAGQVVPKELRGDGVIKQKAKLREMLANGYQQPMDYADLAKKRLSGELVELPMATEYWVLEVGSSATEADFTSFNFDSDVKSPTIVPGSEDYNTLAQLAANFSGHKYDLNNGEDRRQMKQRLLRMFHPRARPILTTLAKAYHARFNRPLRITSLSRSMEYQILLNKTNPNSFTVRGKGSLPPHTSGCAFDLARKHMTAEEQNFLMAELAKMENQGVLDALREGNVNACFHVFIYNDGIPPKM